ncbi:MAG: DUF1566 domain-containing protein [Candidatus Competibacteraceae bacterium]
MKRKYGLFALGASVVLPGVSLADTTPITLQSLQDQLNDRYTKAEIDAKFCVQAKLKRYCDNGDGTVTDTRTNLVWLKNANCYGDQNWQTAMNSAAVLANGTCNLTDGSQAGYWRLPLIGEWQAMVDQRFVAPALSNAAGTGQWTEGDAFSGVQLPDYWSSSSVVDSPNLAWGVSLYTGFDTAGGKTDTSTVWPVRGGQ